MTITATIKRRSPKVGVKLNSNTGSIQTTTPVTIQTNVAKNRIDTLADVNASNEANGATLVYDSTNDTYVVQQLNFSDLAGDLDGGTF